MSESLIKALTSTDENPVVDDTPEELQKEAATPATVRWVKEHVQHSSSACWAKRRLKFLSTALIFALGGMAVWNVYVVRTFPLVIREQVRSTMVEILKEQDTLRALAQVAKHSP